MVDDVRTKAVETRRRNEKLRQQRWAEELEVKQAARLGLKRVFDSEDATPEQTLEAAKLLAQLGR